MEQEVDTSAQQSPVIKPAAAPEPEVADFTIDFSSMLVSAFNGEKITKEEWETEDAYVHVVDGILKIHKDDGKDYNWIISRDDYSGTDWKPIHPPKTNKVSN